MHATLAAVAEELVYRGYFILLWGQRTDSMITFAVISCIVFVAAHLYQGKQHIVYYTFLTIVLAVSTILSGSIMIAIGAHIYCNILATVGLWYHDSKKDSLTKSEELKEQPVFSPNSVQAQRPKTSHLAKAALILGILALFTFTFSFGIPAITGLIMGTIALAKIKKSDSKLAGKSLAIAGIITSLISLILTLIMVAFILWVFGVFGNVTENCILEQTSFEAQQYNSLHN